MAPPHLHPALPCLPPGCITTAVTVIPNWVHPKYTLAIDAVNTQQSTMELFSPFSLSFSITLIKLLCMHVASCMCVEKHLGGQGMYSHLDAGTQHSVGKKVDLLNNRLHVSAK